MATSLRRFASSSDDWHATSTRARAYYEERHTVDAVMSRFEQVFFEASRRAPAARACEAA
jgi:hypothetical protein